MIDIRDLKTGSEIDLEDVCDKDLKAIVGGSGTLNLSVDTIVPNAPLSILDKNSKGFFTGVVLSLNGNKIDGSRSGYAISTF